MGIALFEVHRFIDCRKGTHLMNTDRDDDSTVLLPATGNVQAEISLDGINETFVSDSVTHLYNPSTSHFGMSGVCNGSDSAILLWIKKGTPNGVYALGQANQDVYMSIRYPLAQTRATEGQVDITVDVTPERHHFQATFDFVAGQQDQFRVTKGTLDISRDFEPATGLIVPAQRK